jgi:D-alanyl-D-alanine carboxypeptidase
VRRAGALVAVLAAGLAGLVAGAAGMARIQDAGSSDDPSPAARQDAATTSNSEADTTASDDRRAAAHTPPETGTAPTPSNEAAPTPDVLLAWTPLGLDPGLVAAATGDAQVSATSVVRGGALDLVGSRTAGGAAVDAPANGWAIPLDAIAVDPAAHAGFASGTDRAALAGLGPGNALLGATSAELRRLGPGDTIELAGGLTVTVSGVVSDSAVGGAELVLDTATGERAGLTTDRYVLAAYDGDRATLEQRLRSALAEDSAVRFRGPGETPYLRNGDAVLPQVLIKQRFGEFAYRRGGTGSSAGTDTSTDEFEQDARWQAENLVSVDLPIIGRARCHRAVVEALAGALGEVVDANLAGLVDPEGFAGCWNARTTRAGNAISRHAWGVAVDLNFGANPTGLASVQDPRLVTIFGRWGFTEGSGWLVPDAGHFEYVSPPRP